MRTLRGPELVAYAQQQIAVVQALLAGHQPRKGWCSCGRQVPCSVASHAVAARQRHLDTLARLDATVELPVFTKPAPPRRARWRRRLLGGAR